MSILSKRKIAKIREIIKHTKIDADLFKFGINLYSRMTYRIFPDRKEMPWPTKIMLELTNKCNLHCVTCPREYDYGKQMKPGEMPTERAFRIIDQAYPYLQSMSLTGMGETLFAPNLVEVARYVKTKKKSIVIFISTNANFPGFIEKIKEVLPYIDTVQVSTDGVGKIYDDIRHGGSFELLDKHLTELVPLAAEHNVDVMFNMVVTKLNSRAMHSVIDYAAEKGVKFVNFSYFNLASVTALPISYYEYYNTEEFLCEKKKAIEAAQRHPQIEVTGIEPASPGSFGKCPLLYNQFQINYDGEIPPCCAKPFSREYSYGNVDTSDLKTVLNSEAAKAFRKGIKTGIAPAFCAHCNMIHRF